MTTKERCDGEWVACGGGGDQETIERSVVFCLLEQPELERMDGDHLWRKRFAWVRWGNWVMRSVAEMREKCKR